jgi:hypothetical protein
VAATSCLAGTFLTVTLLVSGAPAATIGNSPQTIPPCGPIVPPLLLGHCPYHGVRVCIQWKSVVRGGKTFRCCAKWGCSPKHGRG